MLRRFDRLQKLMKLEALCVQACIEQGEDSVDDHNCEVGLFSLFSTLLLKLTRNRIDPSLGRLIYWTLNAPMDTKIGEKYAADTKYCVN